MKKILFLALAAATVMSCTESEEIENVGQKAEIKLGTVVSTTTRAAVTDNASFQAFTVSAYITPEANIAASGLGTAYMDQVNYTGGKDGWTTTGGTYYWPLDEEMHFFAYPTTSKAQYSVAATGYPSLSFEVAATAGEQTDLVVAYEKVTEKPAGNSLTLKFKHALTRINFSYKPADAAYTYTISEIKINGVSGGTASYKYDASNGSWEMTGATANVSYTYPIASNPAIDANGFYPLDDTDGSLMLFPQSVAGKTISVTYKTEKDGHTFFDDTKTVTLPGSAEWGIGQNIRYKLTLPVGASEIILNTDVEETTETGEDGTAN